MGWDDTPELPEGYATGDAAGTDAAGAEAPAPRRRFPKRLLIISGVIDLAIVAAVLYFVFR